MCEHCRADYTRTHRVLRAGKVSPGQMARDWGWQPAGYEPVAQNATEPAQDAPEPAPYSRGRPVACRRS
jgi:hypothetical protein